MNGGRQPRTVIIGAGFGGIAAAIELKAKGLERIEILEAGEGLGGTWLFNTYPGAACDVPSHLYSYSFAQRRDWDRLCPTQPDILDYVRSVASEHGIDRLITFNTKVTACIWDDATSEWTISSEGGRTFHADSVVIATGQLHKPLYPSVPGIANFRGHSFHSAEWDHDWDMSGKRVGVIGTGASAVQFVPEIAETAGRLTVFQRTGNWFMPRKNRRYPKPIALAIRSLPGLQAFRRRFIYWYGETLTLMIRHPRTIGQLGRIRSAIHMRSQVKDPALRAKIWPDYTFGCKRVLFSSFFLPALARDNVDLVTEAIEEVTERGIRTADGRETELDCIVYGTGFRTNDFMFPMEITGRSGRSLRDAWRLGPHAHLGMTVHGFPSMFLMYGPNTNTSGGSILVYLEAQAGYIAQAIQAMHDRDCEAVDLRPEVEVESDRSTQDRFKGTAWTRCNSWYRDEQGRIVANWPGYMHEYEKLTSSFDPTEYEFIGA